MSPLSQLRREKPRTREIIPEEIPPPRPLSSAKMVPSTFEVHEGPLPTAPSQITKVLEEVDSRVTPTITKEEKSRTGIAPLLASTSGLRGAIILREILGPPRGLHSLDLMDVG
jgi:hypothetical protein